MNIAFLKSTRHHDDLIETTATHQIVSDAHGALEFSYAWSAEEAQETAKSVQQRHPHRGEPAVFERGEFIPHYDYDEQ